MQNDPAWEHSDHNNVQLENLQKHTVLIPQKSVSTYESAQTDGSKRSTEEEELRSLSTTPRYSHEDLGRIVSPPHSSEFSSGEADEHFDDTISTQQVHLKSRTTQYTHPHTQLVSDRDSLLSYKTDKTQSNAVSEKAWANQSNVVSEKAWANQSNVVSEKAWANQSNVVSEKAWANQSNVVSEKAWVNQSNVVSEKAWANQSNVASEKAWAKSAEQPYKTTFAFPEKETSTSGQGRHIKELPRNTQASSTVTAPELPSLKVRKEYQHKPNHTDHDFKKPNKLPGVTGYNQLPVSVRTDYRRLRAAELMQMSNTDANLTDIIMDAENMQRDLANEHDHRRLLENQLQDIDEERKELNTKLATLRVKLGVANSNFNVSKNECDKMRKKYQETQIQKARLEERIETGTKELEKLKDPNNPDSNVNLKKVVLNDRKEIRRLRTELEGVRSERSEVQKQIQDKDEKIKMLNIYIGEAKDKLDECHRDYEIAQISVTGEKKKREEVEEKYNELMKDKKAFDEKMDAINEQLDIAISGTSGIQKHTEKYRDNEQVLVDKIDVVEKKLRDALTAIEQQKNRNMPFRTATSIKHHQYRMTTSGWVTDTTPHVIVTTTANGSIASSGFLGKTVVSTKPAKSLPAGKAMSKTTPRSQGGSLPSKR
ncbi:uncharacterized protein LOC123547669 [Mercenaria mercenaria]|uniref:uncharacterized protein LOC123547669 n=1 Tax=Mercenaria mercenaria TaxID=6596 RepID=UPI00234F9C20|nr:uncharacterized protein LOC123547669 [Mercenaria mercenaria]XP_053380715.1 uncharacterized protein LOC123547669 [Mercenaria mercenaria]